jgi:hypothetical protein
MSRGPVETLQFAASIVVAAPVAIFGLFNLAEGKPLVGAVFLGLAVGIVVFEEVVTSPKDLAGMAVDGVTDRLVRSHDEEE